MISLRQHAVSIAAIFLALAIGVVLGSQTLAADLLSGLRSDKAALREQVDDLTERNQRLTEQADAADRFIAGSAGRILGGVLADRSVIVFTTPDADPADVEAVGNGLAIAGASVTGRIALEDAFLDAAEGDRLRTALTNTIPAGAQLRTGGVDQGSLARGRRGRALLLAPAPRPARPAPPGLGRGRES
uniref:copper transporter n=1 Tax=Nocardia farcinica TaxID=37329 RepID=UPI0024585E51